MVQGRQASPTSPSNIRAARFSSSAKSTSLGASWSSVSPDLGPDSILSRFQALEPELLFANTHLRLQGQKRPAGARVRYIGPDGIRYRLWHGWKHRGSGGLARQILKTGRRFDYFTSRTFDFQSSVPLREPGFAVERYLDQICGGIDRHLFGAERNAVPTRSAPSARCEETGRDGQHACQGEGIAHA